MKAAVIGVSRYEQALSLVHGRSFLEYAYDHLRTAGAQSVHVVAQTPNAQLAKACRELGLGDALVSAAGLEAAVPSGAAVFLPIDAALTRPSSLGALFNADHDLSVPLGLTMSGQQGRAVRLPKSLLPSWVHNDANQNNEDEQAQGPRCELVPVPDVFCLGADYFNKDSLESALDSFHLPTVKECHALLDIYRPKPERRAHCLAVAQAAWKMALALNEAGIPVDVDRTHAAALVHDMCKGMPDHAETGAKALRAWGFYGVADEVARHIDLGGDEITEELVLSETGLVYVADKLFDMDRYVGLTEKTRHRLTRVVGKPEREAWMQESNERLCAAARIIEDALGIVDLGFSLWGPQDKG